MSLRIRYLVTTLALVGIGLGYAVLQEWPRHRAPRLPERAEASAHPRSLPALSPMAREILDRAADLALTGVQRGRREALDRTWHAESAGLRTELQAAEEEFSRFMGDAKATRKMSLQEIQGRSEDVRRLGAVLREDRQRHSKAAIQILTSTQRERLMTSRTTNLSGGER